MNMYLQSDKEISFVLQKIPYKKLWNRIELGVVHKLQYIPPIHLFTGISNQNIFETLFET